MLVLRSCYSMFLGFARSPVNFHAEDGSGYEFMGDSILKVRMGLGLLCALQHALACFSSACISSSDRAAKQHSAWLSLLCALMDALTCIGSSAQAAKHLSTRSASQRHQWCLSDNAITCERYMHWLLCVRRPPCTHPLMFQTDPCPLLLLRRWTRSTRRWRRA